MFNKELASYITTTRLISYRLIYRIHLRETKSPDPDYLNPCLFFLVVFRGVLMFNKAICNNNKTKNLKRHDVTSNVLDISAELEEDFYIFRLHSGMLTINGPTLDPFLRD